MITFVVLLTYRGAYKGMVGPFEAECDAEAWALDNADVQAGWSWDVDPLVSPERLAEYAPAASYRPLLRVVS